MAKLNVPSREFVEKYLISNGYAESRNAGKAAEAFLKIYQSPSNFEDDPIAAILSEDGIVDLQNSNFELIEKGVASEERARIINGRLDELLSRAFAEENEAAVAIEKQLGEMSAQGKFESDDHQAAWAAAMKLPLFAKIPKIRIWILTTHNHYSSVRGGTAKGSKGKGLKKKCSTLRVAATTVGSNITTKLFWATPWGNGQQTLFSQSIINSTVISTHWRGCFLGLIPQGSANILARSIWNGVPSQSTSVSWQATCNKLWLTSDPNLTNGQYFGSSNWNGIPLSVSGTV